MDAGQSMMSPLGALATSRANDDRLLTHVNSRVTKHRQNLRGHRHTRGWENLHTHTPEIIHVEDRLTVIVSEVISKLHFLEIKKEKLESKFFIIVSICSAASSSSANIRPPDVNVLFFHRALFYYKTRNTCHQTLTALTLCCACLWKINNDQIIN